MLSFLAHRNVKLLVPDTKITCMRPSSDGLWLGVLSPLSLTIWSLRREQEFRLVGILGEDSFDRKQVGAFTALAWYDRTMVVTTDEGIILLCDIAEKMEEVDASVQVVVTVKMIIHLPTAPTCLVISQHSYVLMDASGITYQLSIADPKEEPKVYTREDREVSAVAISDSLDHILIAHTRHIECFPATCRESIKTLAFDFDILGIDVAGSRLAVASRTDQVLFYDLEVDASPQHFWSSSFTDACHRTSKVSIKSIQWSLGPVHLLIATLDVGIVLIDPTCQRCVYLEANEASIALVDPLSCIAITVPLLRPNVIDVIPLAVSPYLVRKNLTSSPTLFLTRDGIYFPTSQPTYIPYPLDYVTDNGCVNFATESPDGKYVVVCADRGFAIFSHRSSKWFLLDISDERTLGKVSHASFTDSQVAIIACNSRPELFVWDVEGDLSLSTARRWLWDHATKVVDMAWYEDQVTVTVLDRDGSHSFETLSLSEKAGGITRRVIKTFSSPSSSLTKCVPWFTNSELKCVSLASDGTVAVDGAKLDGTFSDVFAVSASNQLCDTAKSVNEPIDTTSSKSPSLCPVCPSICLPNESLVNRSRVSDDCSLLFTIKRNELCCLSANLEEIRTIELHGVPHHLDLISATWVEPVAPIKIEKTVIIVDLILDQLERLDEASDATSMQLFDTMKSRDGLQLQSQLFHRALSRAVVIIKQLPIGMKTAEDVVSCTRRILHAPALGRIQSLMTVCRLIHQEHESFSISVISSALRLVEPDVTFRMAECLLQANPSDKFANLLRSQKLDEASRLLLLVQQSVGPAKVREQFAIPLLNSCLLTSQYLLAVELLRFIAVHTPIDDLVIDFLTGRFEKGDFISLGESIVCLADFLPSLRVNSPDRWNAFIVQLGECFSTSQLASVLFKRVSAIG